MTTFTIQTTLPITQTSFQSLDDFFWYCVTNNLLKSPAKPEEIVYDPILSAAKEAEESGEFFESVEDLMSDLST